MTIKDLIKQAKQNNNILHLSKEQKNFLKELPKDTLQLFNEGLKRHSIRIALYRT